MHQRPATPLRPDSRQACANCCNSTQIDLHSGFAVISVGGEVFMSFMIPWGKTTQLSYDKPFRLDANDKEDYKFIDISRLPRSGPGRTTTRMGYWRASLTQECSGTPLRNFGLSTASSTYIILTDSQPLDKWVTFDSAPTIRIMHSTFLPMIFQKGDQRLTGSMSQPITFASVSHVPYECSYIFAAFLECILTPPTTASLIGQSLKFYAKHAYNKWPISCEIMG